MTDVDTVHGRRHLDGARLLRHGAGGVRGLLPALVPHERRGAGARAGDRGRSSSRPVHRSNMDTPIVSVVTRRRLRYMGKDSLWKKSLPALGPVRPGRLPGDARVPPTRRRWSAASPSSRAASRWCCSPRVSARAGPLVQPLFDGAAFVAAKAAVPIVPVGIGGSERVMPKGSKLIYPRKVHLVVGPPIVVPGADRGRVPRVGPGRGDDHAARRAATPVRRRAGARGG